MRKIVPDASMARAAALLSLVSVAAIPVIQMGFGIILEWSAAFGMERSAQFQLAFFILGILIISASTVYATSKQADE